MNLKQTIRKILREELYSPAGDEHIPNRVVVHKSNPVWRDNIKLTGLQVSVGECYKTYIGDDVECKEAIFATDTLEKKYMFDSTYDDDIWLINTDCAGVTWYKDKHFEGGDYKYHIVTFENIPPDCLKLIHKGTGKSHSLLEQQEKRNLAPLMKQLLEDTLLGTSKMLCGIEVTNPKDRESVDETVVYTKYRVDLILLGGFGTRYWPRTQSVRIIEENLMNKAQDLILNFMGQMVDVYNTKVSKCESYEKWKTENN